MVSVRSVGRWGVWIVVRRIRFVLIVWRGGISTLISVILVMRVIGVSLVMILRVVGVLLIIIGMSWGDLF